MKVGDTYTSNEDGELVVVDYSGSRRVTVKFVSTGNTYTAQKNAIVNGWVRDVDMRRVQREDAEQQTRARVIFKKHLSALRVLVKDLALWRKEDNKARKLRRREQYRNKFIAKSKRLAKERARETARHYYASNRDTLLRASKDWQRANLDKARVKNQNRRAKRANAEGSHTLEEINSVLVAQDNKCNCCGCSLEDGKHLDHIMPLDLGGSNWIENLQWLCVWCNCSKSAKHPDDWAKEVASPDFLARRFGGSISVH